MQNLGEGGGGGQTQSTTGFKNRQLNESQLFPWLGCSRCSGSRRKVGNRIEYKKKPKENCIDMDLLSPSLPRAVFKTK